MFYIVPGPRAAAFWAERGADIPETPTERHAILACDDG
jgi:hypothetical protein